MDQAIVGAGPDHVDVEARGADRVDHAAARGLLFGGIAVGRDAGREVVGLARQVGADGLPVLAAIGGLEDHLRAEVEHVRIDVAEEQRRGAQIAIVAARIHVFDFAGDAVELRALAAVDDVGIERIGRDVAVLVGADGVPVAKGDLAVVAAAGDTGGAALLLSAVDPVGHLVVGDDVIELRGRLVVPAAPGAAAIDGDGGALVGGEQDDVGVQRD